MTPNIARPMVKSVKRKGTDDGLADAHVSGHSPSATTSSLEFDPVLQQLLTDVELQSLIKPDRTLSMETRTKRKATDDEVVEDEKESELLIDTAPVL